MRTRENDCGRERARRACQQGVPGHTIVFPSGHIVAFADELQPRSHWFVSHFTLHDFAPSQSTEQLPVHSMLHEPALEQPTLD
jgi:hypothetical protein